MDKSTHKIGMFWGSDTGATDNVAEELMKLLRPNFELEGHEIYTVKSDKLAVFDFLILGLSTWHDGQLQSDWDSFFEEFCTIDFSSKVVAFFGLGDQVGYASYFVDGMGTLAEQVEKAGGKIIGNWSTEGYDFDASKGAMNDDWFYGLAIDEEFQPEMTLDRLGTWAKQITGEFQTEMAAAVAG